MNKPFTTPTGQTGKDAYIYEAAQIANLQRELDRRFMKLRETIRDEQPELFEEETDFMWARATEARHFTNYLIHGAGKAAQMERNSLGV